MKYTKSWRRPYWIPRCLTEQTGISFTKRGDYVECISFNSPVCSLWKFCIRLVMACLCQVSLCVSTCTLPIIYKVCCVCRFFVADASAPCVLSAVACLCVCIQEAQLSSSDRAMRLVSSNLANYHATMQKLLIRQVLTKPMVWSWRFSWRQCVINVCALNHDATKSLSLSQVS